MKFKCMNAERIGSSLIEVKKEAHSDAPAGHKVGPCGKAHVGMSITMSVLFSSASLWNRKSHEPVWKHSARADLQVYVLSSVF